MARPLIQGVTFDFWNTLVAENPNVWKERAAAQRRVIESVGLDRNPEHFERAATRLWDWFHESWHANRPIDVDVAARRFVHELGIRSGPEFAIDGASDADGLVVERPVADAIAREFGAIYRAGSDPRTMTVADGVGEVLEGLRSRGIVIGIISDVGFTPGAALRGYLAHHGLLLHFHAWTFSDEVGEFKPAPAMFAHAAAGLGVDDPGRLAHVGDLRRTDVGGAVAAGWTAVRYRGLHDDAEADAPDADFVIDDHLELLDLLSGW